jgi:hypothetical protein
MSNTLIQECTNFLKFQEPTQSTSRQKGDMKEVPYCGSTNIRHQCTKFCCLGDLAPRICASLQ